MNAESGSTVAAYRLEDGRMLSGRGEYVDNFTPASAIRAYVVRSTVAHARILSIDLDQARSAPGVLAVFAGSDCECDGLGHIPCVSIPPSVMGGRWFRTPFPLLAVDRVVSVGQGIAIVLAESLAQAMDAAELVQIDYEILPAVDSVEAAIRPDAPRVWPDCPGNICFTHELGEQAATDRAFARADHVTRLKVYNQRLAGNPIEPRGCIGHYDAASGRYDLRSSTANPHRIRLLLAENVLKVPAHSIRVVAGDVGGGFGTKGGLYPEEALVLWASRKTGRPVKWISDRSEGFISDFNGRDQLGEIELALGRDGRILGARVTLNHNLGCQVGPSGAHPALIGARMLSGVYDIPAMHVTIRGVLTHTRTLTTYRGAGRPEAIYLIERAIDLAARELGLGRVELRRKNFISPQQMPYRTATGETYDCGEFEAAMDRALVLADWDGFAKRRESSRARGRLRGRGLGMYIEVCAALGDRMEIRFDPTGDVTVIAGTFSYGQGHETTYAQMLAGWLGLDYKRVRYIHGDTDKVAYGRGSFGSRSMAIGGSALRAAADLVIERGRRAAAHLLEASEGDIEFEAGIFRVAGTDRQISLRDVARTSYRYGNTLPAELASGLEAVGTFSSPYQNYPNGCYVVELEVDPDTGIVELDKIVAVDDVGRVINPVLFDGQVHGSIAQGVGQALLESMEFDGEGQVLSGSFIDYAMPRADVFPDMLLTTRNVPTGTNPLGVKGGAETGTVGIPAAVIGAVLDALSPFDVRDIDMPATPQRIWRAMSRAPDSPPAVPVSSIKGGSN